MVFRCCVLYLLLEIVVPRYLSADNLMVKRIPKPLPPLDSAAKLIDKTDPTAQALINFALKNGDKLYFVVAGDSLSRIAFTYTGESRHWREIAVYNRLQNASDLRPGMVILIPRWLLGIEPLHSIESRSLLVEPNTNSRFDLQQLKIKRLRKSNESDRVRQQEVRIRVGEFSLFESAEIRRVAVKDESLLQVGFANSAGLLLAGLRPGVTNMRLQSRQGKQSHYRVIVLARDDTTEGVSVASDPAVTRKIEVFSPHRVSHTMRKLLINTMR